MKKSNIITLIVPLINIIIASILTLIALKIPTDNYTAWRVVINAAGVFLMLHFALAVIVPIVLYRNLKGFSAKVCFMAVSSIMVADIFWVLQPIAALFYKAFVMELSFLSIMMTVISIFEVVLVSFILLVIYKKRPQNL